MSSNAPFQNAVLASEIFESDQQISITKNNCRFSFLRLNASPIHSNWLFLWFILLTPSQRSRLLVYITWKTNLMETIRLSSRESWIRSSWTCFTLSKGRTYFSYHANSRLGRKQRAMQTQTWLLSEIFPLLRKQSEHTWLLVLFTCFVPSCPLPLWEESLLT